MALRGAISLGKQQLNTNSLHSVSTYLRASYTVVSASNNPFTRSIKHNVQLPTGVNLRYQIRAVSGTATDPVSQNKKDNEEPSSSSSPENWKIKMLYDGDCPLCMKEVDMLRERNKTYGTIKFVDISSDEYSPEENQGLDYETAMGRIHAIQSDGTVVRDIEVFRKLYEAVGLGWVYAITKYEPVATIADAVYGVWAKYRLQVTGRPPLEEVLEARRKKKEMCEDSKVCKM